MNDRELSYSSAVHRYSIRLLTGSPQFRIQSYGLYEQESCFMRQNSL